MPKPYVHRTRTFDYHECRHEIDTIWAQLARFYHRSELPQCAHDAIARHGRRTCGLQQSQGAK
jgi:hypothetical protein